MNERFVCVKVDREERPDVDGLYMEAVLALNGHGGWPMTVFLTPDGRPFWGGTYFPRSRGTASELPRRPRGRVRGLPRAARRPRPPGRALTEAIRDASRIAPSDEPLTSHLLTGAVATARRAFDSERGGFGGAPKFRPHSTLELLLRLHDSRGTRRSWHGDAHARRMAAGGMYDLVGGGFHRYSVDADWLVPHFEKMLYDNALLVTAYLHGWVVTGASAPPHGRGDARLHGARAAAPGAASHRPRTPTPTASRAHLHLDGRGARGRPRRAARGVAPPFRARALVLRGEIPEDARRGSSPRVRSGRSPPATTRRSPPGTASPSPRSPRPGGGSSARTSSTSPRARGVPARPALRRRASCSGAGARRREIDGYLEDYACVANGLLELYLATGDARWLEEARRVALLAVELFEDPQDGGFFGSRRRRRLVARRKELDDNPTPSGNAMLAFVLLRLSRLYGDDELER